MSTYDFAQQKLAEVDTAAVTAYPDNTPQQWAARFAYRERELRRLLLCKLSAEARACVQRQFDILVGTL